METPTDPMVTCPACGRQGKRAEAHFFDNVYACHGPGACGVQFLDGPGPQGLADPAVLLNNPKNTRVIPNAVNTNMALYKFFLLLCRELPLEKVERMLGDISTRAAMWTENDPYIAMFAARTLARLGHKVF